MTSEPYLQVEACGSIRSEPLYIITKHVPAKSGYPAKAVAIRCMDLGKEALGNYKAEEGGCAQIQFYNAVSDLRCARCGIEFNKLLMKREPYIAIKGLPD